MSYIGNTSITQAFTPAVDFFNGNGSTTAFTLSRPVASVAQVQAVISNVPQKPGDAFTVSGNTITFTSAPPSGTSNIYVYYTSPITQVIAPGQNTVGTTQIQDNAITTAKIAAGAVIPADLSTGAPTWDANGNVGLNGIAPLNAYAGSNFKSYELTRANLFAFDLGNRPVGGFTTNSYLDSSANPKYIATGYATKYENDQGKHTFYGAPYGAANGAITFTQLVAFEKDKSLALQGASSVAGTGISFPATQSASSDANTLDDYEEGTWGPVTLTNGTCTLTNSRYTKIGRLVTISGYLQTFSDRSTASTLNINGGFPYAPSAATENCGAMIAQYVNGSYSAAYVSSGGMYFYGITSGAFTTLRNSDLNNASAQIYFTVTYTTST